jgi:hypothetical protein
MPTIDDVLPSIRSLKPVPTALLVWCAGDDAPKRVALPNVRNRWARVGAVLAKLDWRRIEAHDKAGGVLGAYALDDDDAADASAPSVGGLTIREREIGDLVLLSFKQSHAMFTSMFGSLLASVRGQMESMATTQRQLTASYERMLVVQRETMQLQAGATEAGGDDGGLADVVRTLVEREARKSVDGERKPADKSGKKSAASVR